jgi:hypothetical protein
MNGNPFNGAIFILIGLLVIMLLLSGCSSNEALRSVNSTPVCKALIGPIKYNSRDPKSRRHAGPDLAPDLKQRNQVGQSLHCAAYR